MKLVTYKGEKGSRLGFVLGNRVVDVNAGYEVLVKKKGLKNPYVFPKDMITLLKDGDEAMEALQQIKGALDKRKDLIEGVSLRLTEVSLMAPVPNPGKILCLGLNYQDHAKETGLLAPKEPIVFGKYANSVIGPNEAILIPPVTRRVDYEAELALVIGKRAYRVEEEEALSHVAGYMNFNDVSARDLQSMDGQWMKGKFLDTFAPMGPWLVTKDEIEDAQGLDITLRLNSQVMQSSNTANMIFGISYIISYLSQLLTLEPGDIIATGTPSGVGFSRKPPVYLKAGDRVEVEISGLGVLQNSVRSS